MKSASSLQRSEVRERRGRSWRVLPQQSNKIARVGILRHGATEEDEAPYPASFRERVKELRYIEGKNIELINRFADEHYDRFMPSRRNWLTQMSMSLSQAFYLALWPPSE
jgi:hypothetical protein